MIDQRFSPDAPICCTQGRNGELIVAQGRGVRPARYDGGASTVDAGMDAPSSPPSVTPKSPVAYYVARVDVQNSGACYYAPPEVSLSFSGDTAVSRHRAAKASSFLSQSALSEIRVDDGGKYYPSPPSVELSDTHGNGAVLEAVLDGAPAGGGGGDPFTGITEWKIVQAPDFLDAAGLDDKKTWYYGAGSTVVPASSGRASFQFRFAIPRGGLFDGLIFCSASNSWSTSGFAYTASGGSGSGATVRLTFGAPQFACSVTGTGGGGVTLFRGAREILSVEAVNYGRGYKNDETVVLRIPSGSGDASRDIIIHGVTSGSTQNTAAQRFGLSRIVVKNGGSGFLVAPQIKISSSSGFGAYATCSVKDGKIVEVTLENGGGGYKTPPTVEPIAGGAEAFAVSRPHLRGVYQCYYRYVDGVPESRGGPIPSNLSPVLEVDTGEGAKSIEWSCPSPTGRAKRLELWRTTSNQATTLYRVAVLDTASQYEDDLTDEELRDPDRTGYAAMPIVLPNGQLNANRFGVPPRNMSTVVRFQDRYWYAVDTSGQQANTILYSEVDEPESVPDINEIILQQNSRDSDAITALVPYGPMMIVMQSRACHSLTFAKQPFLDAQVSPMAYRGSFGQRCWDILDGVAYVLDQYGLYSINATGQVDALSQPVDDIFAIKVDKAKSRWFFVAADPTTRVVRAFVALKGDGSRGHPTVAMCYHVDSKTWWQERYPQRLSGSCAARLSNGDYRNVYAGAGGLYLLGEGASDLARGAVVKTTLTNAGSGYSSPPAVSATGGSGAQFQAAISADGKVTAVWITAMGYGYTGGDLYIAPPDRPTGTQAAATFSATPLDQDTSVFTPYRFRTGSMMYVTDSQDPKAAATNQRNVSLQYRPQSSSCELAMRLYYNNSPHPRPNVAPRDRGVGFTSNTVDSGGRLDMAASMTKYGADTGVANALLSGRTMDDISSADRSVAVELAGARKAEDPVVVYSLQVGGTQT